MKQRLTMLALMLTSAILLIVKAQIKLQCGTNIFTESGGLHCLTIQGVGGKREPALSGVGQRLSKAGMRRQITSRSAEMPAFANILEKPELKDMIAYLHSCHDRRGR